MSANQSHHLPRIKINPKQPRSVRLDWWEQAASLTGGKALHLCLGLWIMISIRQSPTVQLSRGMMKRVNISRYAAGDAIRKLEEVGLVKVARLKGRSPRITCVEKGTSIPLRLDGSTK